MTSGATRPTNPSKSKSRPKKRPAVRKASARKRPDAPIAKGARWVLEELQTRCWVFAGQAKRAEALLAYRFSYRPRDLAGILKLAPPERYALVLDLAPQPDTARQALWTRNVLAPGAGNPNGSIDRSHLGDLAAKLGTTLGGATGPLAAGWLGASWAGVPGALIGLGGLLGGALLGTDAVQPAVPFVLGPGTFGWRYAATDNTACPYGILEGGAVLELDRSIRYLSLDAAVHTGPREQISARRVRIALETVPPPPATTP